MAKKILVAAAIVAGMALSSSIGIAAPIGPVGFGSVPGTVTFTPSGAATPADGTRIWTYTGIDTSQFSELWWGPSGVGSAMDGTINLGEMMSFSSASGQVATWTGMTTVAAQSGTLNVYTKFTATILSGATGWLAPGDVDITPGPLQVTEVTSGPFSVGLAFFASLDNVSFGVFNAVYNSIPRFTSGQTRTSVGGQFFYTENHKVEAVVPLPAALPLFAAGLGAMGFFGWRKKRKAVLTA